MFYRNAVARQHCSLPPTYRCHSMKNISVVCVMGDMDMYTILYHTLNKLLHLSLSLSVMKGYWQGSGVLVTHSPTPSSAAQLWRTMLDKRCTTIIAFSQCDKVENLIPTRSVLLVSAAWTCLHV